MIGLSTEQSIAKLFYGGVGAGLCLALLTEVTEDSDPSYVIQVVEQGVGSFVAAGAQGLTVALDTTLTGELRREGLAREIINKVQNLRKKSGLEVSDRIDLAITGSEEVLAAVAEHQERITGETLATGVAADGDLAYKDSFDIDDNAIGIALEKA